MHIRDSFKKSPKAIVTISLLAISSVLLIAGVTYMALNRVVQASTNNFSPGNLISQSLFEDNNAMSAADIQNFFNRQNSICLKDYTGLALIDANGNGQIEDWTTAERYGGPNGTQRMTAAQLIKAAGDIYGINPQVLIATLQKEQGLITRTDCPQWRYNTAFGFGCPDTAPCDQSAYGFTRQLDNAAYHFKNYMTGKDVFGNRVYSTFKTGTHTIQWHPDASCGGSSVNIQNLATASLYTYTPYQPNRAALNAGYGLGNDCSSYGNRNFTLYMRDWFGVNAPHSTAIVCDGSIYIIENTDSRKRQILPTHAADAWNKQLSDYTSGGGLCGLSTYDLPAERVIRSRTTGKLYYIDQGVAHYLPKSSAEAWGIEDGVYPQFDGKTIHEHLDVSSEPLPRIVTSTNEERSDYYLLDDGKRHTITGTPSGDMDTLRLFRGYEDGPVKTASITSSELSAIPLDKAVSHSVEVGSRQYIADHGNVKEIASASEKGWGKLLPSTTTLSQNFLSLYDDIQTIDSVFYRDGTYYHILEDGSIQSTENSKLASLWSQHKIPTITRLLTGLVTPNAKSIAGVNYFDDSKNNIVIFKCENTSYLVERHIRTKRKISPEGLAAWSLDDTYFPTGSSQRCSYPDYALEMGKVVRSRNTGKVYYLSGNKAYLIKNQADAASRAIGSIDDTFPMVDPPSIHDNFTVIR